MVQAAQPEVSFDLFSATGVAPDTVLPQSEGSFDLFAATGIAPDNFQIAGGIAGREGENLARMDKVSPRAPTSPALNPGEELASDEDRSLLKERLSKSLANFTKKTGEAWKRFTETKVAKQVAEYVKSKHPYISLVLGPVLGAGIGFINPEWGQWFLAHSGQIRMAAVAAMPLFSAMEVITGRETTRGKLARAARFVAWDVSLATMTAPFGVGLGIGGHEMMSEALKHFPAPAVEATAPVTATDVSKAVATVAPSETHTATPHAEASATPPATPDIQPTWEAGHVPTQEQLDWAKSHDNMKPIDIDSKGGADFYAYNLDTSDPNPEAYVHIKTGQVFYETPDGKWAVDIDKDGIPDALYSQSPVPETSGGSGRGGLGLARPVSSGIQEGDPPPLENINLAGDSTPDLFYDGSNWQLDIDGDGDPDQPVEIDGLVNNGGVWDWSDIKITSPDGTYEWKFEDIGTGDGSWVQSDLLSPIERGVHDVNPDVTITAGQGKWHAGENYLNRILSSATSHDTDLVRNLSKGEGANTIAVDAVKDVLESHNVPTTVGGDGSYHVNIDPSFNQEIGARIQTTVDKINGWFTPGDDAKRNEILAEMSNRGLIPVKNLTVEGLDGLSKLAAALTRGG